MKPGKELDREVAIKVMNIDPSNIDCEKFGRGVYADHYSTDISAAWKILKKIPMSIYAPNAPMANGEYGNSGPEWEAEATIVGRPHSDVVNERGESAAHAICLAALKAVQSGNKND